MREKLKVGLVQIDNSFFGQSYFPLSAGLLQSYAQNHLGDLVNFLPIIHTRLKLDEVVNILMAADVVGFSVYIWNFNISLAIAEKLKTANPGVLIVFGGHHVPCRSAEDFLKRHPYIDLACHGDGEKAFTSILQNIGGDWRDILSVSFLDENGSYVETIRPIRDKNLDDLPSPYLTGVFNRLMDANPGFRWIGMWETNRGCPFSCAWCDWHGSKLGKWGMERISKEIRWFTANKIEFINCVDANFGILPRDVEIARLLADAKKRTGYPQAVSIQSTKNLDENSFRIQEILKAADMNRVVVMSVQSLNPPTLKAVGRSNIPLEAYRRNQKRFNELGIPTVTDMILGQPEETYESWINGLNTLLTLGQHNRIQFGNLTKLPNSALADPEYLKKYGLRTVESAMVNNHGSLPEANEIVETQELVIATDSMPAGDWVRARVFSWMTGLLHFDKILQIPFVVLNGSAGLSYSEIIEFFSGRKFRQFGKFPILEEIWDFFTEKARDIQNGGYEFCHSSDWLNIFWPADEFMFIGLCVNNKLSCFYAEAEISLTNYLKSKGVEIGKSLIDDSICLNRALIKLPFVSTNKKITLNHNIWEYYRSVIIGKPVSLKAGAVTYMIKRVQEQWPTWNDWFEKVVWWGHRKGAYIYNDVALQPEPDDYYRT